MYALNNTILIDHMIFVSTGVKRKIFPTILSADHIG